MRRTFGMCVVVSIGLMTACSGGPGDPEDAPTSELEALVLENCNYRYVCPLVGDSDFAKEVAHRDAGADGAGQMVKYETLCQAEHIDLMPGGRASYASTDITWAVDGHILRFCESEGSCIACEMLDGPAAPGAGSGRCTGSASSCSMQPSGFCTAQRGCDVSTRSTVDGNFEIECRGSARSCSSFSDAGSCGKQTGCRWE